MMADDIVERLRSLHIRIGAWKQMVPGEYISAYGDAAAEIERLRASEWEYKERAENAESFIGRRGYRRCDSPACNCGSWHGGDYEQRFDELSDVIGGVGKTLLKAAQDLKASEAQAIDDADALCEYLRWRGLPPCGFTSVEGQAIKGACMRALERRKAKEASNAG